MIVPQRIGVWALVIGATLSPVLPGEMATGPVPVEEQRVLDALAAGRAEDAIAGLAAAVDARAAQAATDPATAAAEIDELATAVFQAGGASAAAVTAVDAAVQRALALRTRTFGEHSVETAKSFSTMLTLAYYRGRWDDAEASGRRVLAVLRDNLPAGDVGLADTLNSLGVVLVRQGRLAEAEPFLAESIRTYAASPGDHTEALLDVKNSLAELYRQQDRLVDSERTFREAIASAETLGPEARPLLARLQNNLGGLLKDEGNLAEAEALDRRSLALREGIEHPDPADLSVAHLNLAEIYRLEGNAAEAEPLYVRSIELARAGLGPDHPDLATHYGQLAALYRDTGRIADARRLSDQAMALLSRTLGPDNPLLAQALNDRGILETDAGRPAVALPNLKRALAIRERAYGHSHFEVAATLTELARAESAPAIAQTARAAAHLDRALKILDATEAYPETAIDARVLRAELARRRGDVVAAGADLASAAGSVESLRPRSGGGEATRATFLAKHAVVFEQLVDLSLSQGRVEDAFVWSERARGRALLDQLASAGVDLRRGIPEPKRSELRAKETAAAALVAEWRSRSEALIWRDDLAPAERQTRLDAAQRELASAIAGLRRVDEETKNESALWRSSSGGAPASVDAARRLLDPGERLFSYQVGTTGSWLIEIPEAPAKASAQRLSVGPAEARELGIAAGRLTRAGLEHVLDGPAGLLEELRRPPIPGFPDDTQGALEALFEVLVPPGSRAAWKSANGAIIIPDGPLTRLPFEALVTATKRDSGSPDYWIDSGPPVRYTVSATLLGALSDRAPVPGAVGLLSVADPDYGPKATTRWKRLPGTAAECDAVTAAFKNHASNVPVTVLRGAAADEPAVRAALEGKRYLHLAVHGVVDEGRGDLLAALALAPSREPAHGSSDDGLLQLFEIYELNLDCDVAVLSACSTHAGVRVEGEGVFALSRGFLARGTRRVIASRWEVDDASTATLVASVFDSVARAEAEDRPADYAAILAAAKRNLRSQHATAAPFYWAPFVLSGLR